MAFARICREEPLDFIRRNGTTLTREVAQRFARDHRNTLRLLRALEREGKVTSALVPVYESGAGKGLAWTATQTEGA
jgi:hypothetical protein